MVSYKQWAAYMDKGDIKRVMYVCGVERILVEEIIARTKAALNLSDMDYVPFDAGIDTAEDIFLAACQYPVVPEAPRLILIRHADNFKAWGYLHSWLDSRQLPTYIIFISDEPDFPYTLAPNGKKGPLKPHVEAIRARGRIVKCSTPKHEDIVQWVVDRAKGSLDHITSEYLVDRSSGNLWLAANVCSKLTAVGAKSVGTEIIDQLCTKLPEFDFVDSLLLSNKKDAFKALENTDENEYSRIIGLLDTRLDFLLALNRQVRAGKRLQEIVQTPGFPLFLVNLYMSVAKNYTQSQVSHCRKVLAICDDALKLGAREGVMEALTTLF